MKSAEKSGRYMTTQQVAAHYGVDEGTIRKPAPGGRFAKLRRVKLTPGRHGIVRYLRSDVDALDREILKAAMTVHGERLAPDADERAA
jgi:hypothetical protein